MPPHIALLVFILISTNAFRTPYPTFRNLPQTGDAGVPLILTPYIENGLIQEARTASEVHHRELRGVQSFSGYFTVDKAFNSNLFFWFFPNEDKRAPVLLWLQGGPGASSLFGLFTENGPFVMKHKRMAHRWLSWTQTHSVVYIDNPVGTGFSFTNGGYAKNETVIGKQLYAALLQFFQVFPEHQQNDFYVTGESYGGKYVPALSYTIHTNNPNSSQRINLKGLAIGNGFSDPIHQYQYGDYLYQIGLLDTKGRDTFKEVEEKGLGYIKSQQWSKAYDTFNDLMDGDNLNTSIFKNLTGFDNYYNYLYGDEQQDPSLVDLGKFIQKTDVRKAIHVGNTTFESVNLDVNANLKEDIYQSVAPWVAELLAHYRVLVYTGHLDIIVAYPLTENYLKNLNFTGAQEYKTAERGLWHVKGRLAGYVKVAGNLTEVLVRNAGHMVPADRPLWALDMITRFTHKKAF